MATELVRVRDKNTGHHYTTTATAAAINPNLEVLHDRPAVDRNGNPLPHKPYQPKAATMQPKTAAKKES